MLIDLWLKKNTFKEKNPNKRRFCDRLLEAKISFKIGSLLSVACRHNTDTFFRISVFADFTKPHFSWMPEHV